MRQIQQELDTYAQNPGVIRCEAEEDKLDADVAQQRNARSAAEHADGLNDAGTTATPLSPACQGLIAEAQRRYSEDRANIIENEQRRVRIDPGRYSMLDTSRSNLKRAVFQAEDCENRQRRVSQNPDLPATESMLRATQDKLASFDEPPLPPKVCKPLMEVYRTRLKDIVAVDRADGWTDRAWALFQESEVARQKLNDCEESPPKAAQGTKKPPQRKPVPVPGVVQDTELHAPPEPTRDCGAKPPLWVVNHSIRAVEKYLQKSLNDPDSLAWDDDACGDPVMTKKCWTSVCGYRAKNAMNALIHKRTRFWFTEREVLDARDQ